MNLIERKLLKLLEFECNQIHLVYVTPCSINDNFTYLFIIIKSFNPSLLVHSTNVMRHVYIFAENVLFCDRLYWCKVYHEVYHLFIMAEFVGLLSRIVLFWI